MNMRSGWRDAWRAEERAWRKLQREADADLDLLLYVSRCLDAGTMTEEQAESMLAESWQERFAQ